MNSISLDDIHKQLVTLQHYRLGVAFTFSRLVLLQSETKFDKIHQLSKSSIKYKMMSIQAYRIAVVS